MLLVKLINGLETTVRLYEIAASLRLIQSNWLALFFAHRALTEFLGTLLAYTQVTAILKQVSSDAFFANYALRLFLQYVYEIKVGVSFCYSFCRNVAAVGGFL
jgi:hypothetical protein